MKAFFQFLKGLLGVALFFTMAIALLVFVYILILNIDANKVQAEIKEGVKHLQSCEEWKLAGTRNSYYLNVYFQNDLAGEISIDSLLNACYAHIGEINPVYPTTVSITFFKNCVIIPDDPDRQYPHVIKAYKQQKIVEFRFAQNDSISSPNLYNIIFWKDGIFKRLVDIPSTKNVVDMDSIGNLKLNHFLKQYFPKYGGRKYTKKRD